MRRILIGYDGSEHGDDALAPRPEPAAAAEEEAAAAAAAEGG